MSEALETQLLFAGNDISVRSVLSSNTDLWAVTFANFERHPQPGRPGFGEAFLKKNGISALHFVSSANHWWQTPEIITAIARAQEFLEKHFSSATRVGYGSSMGGYGVLLYAQALRLDRVLAISPQYSIDSDKVPFETRWREEASQLSFAYDAMPKKFENCHLHIVYDGQHAGDSEQVKLFPKTLQRHSLPLSDHPSSKYLLQTGALKSLVLDFFRHENPAPQLAVNLQKAIQNRRQSPVYLKSLLHRCQKRDKALSAVVVAQALMERAGRNPALRILAADAYRRVGDELSWRRHLKLAEQDALREIASRGDSPNLRWLLRGIYLRLNQIETALREAHRALEMGPPRRDWRLHVEELKERLAQPVS